MIFLTFNISSGDLPTQEEIEKSTHRLFNLTARDHKNLT